MECKRIFIRQLNIGSQFFFHLHTSFRITCRTCFHNIVDIILLVILIEFIGVFPIRLSSVCQPIAEQSSCFQAFQYFIFGSTVNLNDLPLVFISPRMFVIHPAETVLSPRCRYSRILRIIIGIRLFSRQVIISSIDRQIVVVTRQPRIIGSLYASVDCYTDFEPVRNINVDIRLHIGSVEALKTSDIPFLIDMSQAQVISDFLRTTGYICIYIRLRRTHPNILIPVERSMVFVNLIHPFLVLFFRNGSRSSIYSFSLYDSRQIIFCRSGFWIVGR